MNFLISVAGYDGSAQCGGSIRCGLRYNGMAVPNLGRSL
jgi:hypothetical protein